MMRPSKRCPLDVCRRRRSRERWQIVCAHLRGGLVTRREFDQRRFAESCPEEADPERNPKYYAGRNLNNGIAWGRGQSGSPEDEMVAIDQIGGPRGVISR